MHGLLQDVEAGYVRSVAFAAPPGADWTLPLYELALQTAERAQEMCQAEVDFAIVSHEARPLEIFGTAASELVETLLGAAGIRFSSGDELPAADRVIALPVPAGPRIPGLPHDDDGFLRTRPDGGVAGAEHVWAAGDCTDFAIKQGGLAAQQAAIAARSIAEVAGARVRWTAPAPILRAMLIAGRSAYYLRRRLDGVDPGTASKRPLWWPPSKIAGRRLAPYLDGLDLELGAPGVERSMVERVAVKRLFVARTGS
jgi:sulfide:quinone oxidoreductase